MNSQKDQKEKGIFARPLWRWRSRGRAFSLDISPLSMVMADYERADWLARGLMTEKQLRALEGKDE